MVVGLVWAQTVQAQPDSLAWTAFYQVHLEGKPWDQRLGPHLNTSYTAYFTPAWVVQVYDFAAADKPSRVIRERCGTRSWLVYDSIQTVLAYDGPDVATTTRFLATDHWEATGTSTQVSPRGPGPEMGTGFQYQEYRAEEELMGFTGTVKLSYAALTTYKLPTCPDSVANLTARLHRQELGIPWEIAREFPKLGFTLRQSTGEWRRLSAEDQVAFEAALSIPAQYTRKPFSAEEPLLGTP